MAEGRAPNLARLAREGLARPTLLPYTPPAALTISEVGWATIAAGVGPAKHGVNGFMLNNDPGQATKNGYADILTRAESLRPSTSTFLASDWANIGLPAQRRPDLRHRHRRALRAGRRGQRGLLQPRRRRGHRSRPPATCAAATPTPASCTWARVDETAHLIGSATPAYRDAIGAADKRIGALTEAVRQRATYGLERWTVIVTTDHGQQDLDYAERAEPRRPQRAGAHLVRVRRRPGNRRRRNHRPRRGGHRTHGHASAGAGRQPGLEPGRPLVRHRRHTPAPARRARPPAPARQQADAGAGRGRGSRSAGHRLRAPGAAARPGAEARHPPARAQRQGEGGAPRAARDARERRRLPARAGEDRPRPPGHLTRPAAPPPARSRRSRWRRPSPRRATRRWAAGSPRASAASRPPPSAAPPRSCAGRSRGRTSRAWCP